MGAVKFLRGKIDPLLGRLREKFVLKEGKQLCLEAMPSAPLAMALTSISFIFSCNGLAHPVIEGTSGVFYEKKCEEYF